MKTVQFPRGTTVDEDAVTGAEGQVRVDISKGALRVHDGQKQGGHELPTTEMVRALIASSGSENQVADVRYYVDEAELSDAAVAPAAVAILGADGEEEILVWKPGADDGGGIPSNVEGHWRRLDSRAGQYVRMHRAGMFVMQFGGSEPVASQDVTPWLDNGVPKLWDGADYQIATPALFARLLAEIGGYDTLVTLPDRIADIIVEQANLNSVTDTGWYKSAAADVNAPVGTASLVFHSKIDANTMRQEFFLQGSATRDTYVRFKAAGTWGSWVLVPGIYPDRIAATSGAVTDANSASESGMYSAASTATNIPAAVNGALVVVRRSSTSITQIFMSSAGNAVYFRNMIASVWQAWVNLYPADVTVATGTLPRANVGITTIGQAEAEAGSATTDRIFTAQRVFQAIAAYLVTILASTANILANTASKWLTTTGIYAAAAEVTLTDAATITVDMNTFWNAVVTLAGNRALGNPTNEKVGQNGVIRIVQDATGSRTLSYGTDWEFAGGSAPTLTTTANAQDLLVYHVLAADRVYATLIKAVA